MQRAFHILLPVIAAAFLLASCHSVPDHARYIPDDALVVIGVHTGKMRQKLAWSAITGSNLIDELRKTGSGDKMPAAMKDLEASGIDFSSTLYCYSKQDTRFMNGAALAAVLPVADAQKLTAFIQKYAPGAAVHTEEGRSEIMIDNKVCISWNKEVLIVMNPIARDVVHREPATDDTVHGEGAPEEYPWAGQIADPAATSAAMNAAFHPVKDRSMTGNSRFKKLEADGHDITMWVACDKLMNAYAGRGGADIGMTDMAMGNMLWKSSVMAAGLDFEDGSIKGEMLYYPSDSMRPVAKEFGQKNIDNDMLRRLSATGLNFAAGYHLSPSAVRMMLDKMGLSGIANLALIQHGLSVDDILGAFSGDMVIAVNNFRVETNMEEMDSATQATYDLMPYPVAAPEMDFVYAIKIGDKAKVTRLMSLVTGKNMLRQASPNVYQLAGTPTGACLVVGDEYIAAGSNVQSAQAFLGTAKGSMPDAVSKELSGHPVGMWADVRSLMAAASPMFSSHPSDSIAYSAVCNMLTTFTAHGGEFGRNGAIRYQMALNFSNKSENSLLQILQLTQQFLAGSNKKEVVLR